MQLEQGGNLPRVKVSNQAAILKTIYHLGPIKRSEIARRLGLTLPTITTNVNGMMAQGIVRETDAGRPEEGLIGRKAHLVDIVPESRHFIGIELQGARRTACLLDYRGKPLYTCEDREDCPEYEENIRRSAGMVSEALASCALTLDRFPGIGVCTPGLVNNEQGILEIRPTNRWRKKDVRGDIAARTGYTGPISVENNVCARAYGAQLFQREVLEGTRTFAYLFIHQGIGCPLVVNTASTFGSVVGAGEAGHMVMVPGGLECSCGNHGCLEAYASDRAVLSGCARSLDQGRAPVLRQLLGEETLSMEHVLTAQEQGDADVAEVVDRAVYILGLAVANINNFACPGKMLIDGKLFCRQENRDRLLKVVEENLWGAASAGAEFVFVKPEALSGAMGAAAMAICKNLETYIEL